MPRYTFGPFSLDPEARVLLRDGEPLPVSGKALDVLVVLVQNRGRLVDKDELLSRVWTGTIVEEANLTQSIFTVRKILGDSPKDHRYIATVPGRGYQFVAPVTELTSETLRTAGAPQEPAVDSVINGNPITRHKLVAVSAIAVAVAAVGALWIVLRRPAQPPSELLERRLTFNSGASPIASAAISPDGKYLAYSDPAGIHLRLLSTGEERPIPTPAGVTDGLSYVDSWFPNGTELLAHSREATGHGSMWAMSIMGKSSRELRGDAAGWEVSPDGRRIAFSPAGTGFGGEIWLMDNQSNNPQKVLGLLADEFLWSVHWSPDGQRLVYVRMRQDRQLMETCDLNGANRTVVVTAEVRSICWLPDGRIVYSQGEARDVDANLWQIGVDTATGKPTGKPQRITRWAGSDLKGMSATADGTRIALRKETYPSQTYIGELDAGGTPVGLPRRLTYDEAHDWATAWTADSKAVLFTSDRGGKWGIFKQAIGQTTAEPLIEGREKTDLARLSADGAWVLYIESSATTSGHSPRQRLMRVPVNGGMPKLVFEIPTAQWENHECARSPASLCVIIESSLDHKQQTVTAVDSISGKARLLRTVNKAIDESFAHSLSPDGSTLAISKGGEPEIHIRLLSMTGGSDREIAVKGWQNIGSLEWSADGKGIYCTSVSSQGGTLLYVDLKGTARVLWHSRDLDGGLFIAGVPSPDGRYLALTGSIRHSTVWMVEGF